MNVKIYFLIPIIPIFLTLLIVIVVLIILGFAVLSGFTGKANQLMQSNNELYGRNDSEYIMSPRVKSEARIFLSYQVVGMGKDAFLSKLPPDIKFTKKEHDIVYLIAAGCTNIEIDED